MNVPFGASVLVFFSTYFVNSFYRQYYQSPVWLATRIHPSHSLLVSQQYSTPSLLNRLSCCIGDIAFLWKRMLCTTNPLMYRLFVNISYKHPNMNNNTFFQSDWHVFSNFCPWEISLTWLLKSMCSIPLPIQMWSCCTFCYEGFEKCEARMRLLSDLHDVC